MTIRERDVQNAIQAGYFAGVEEAIENFAPNVSHDDAMRFMQSKLTEWNDAVVAAEQQQKKTNRKCMLLTLGIAVGLVALPFVIDAIGEHLEQKEKKEMCGEY